jgi:hypothetical protein
MRTRSIGIALIVLTCAGAAALPSLAGADKQLQNSKGSVSYELPSGKSQRVALNGSVVLEDRDYAVTGAESLATVGLPDSSRVLVGSTSKVQLAAFSQAAGTTAKFIVVNGKLRFIVQHPAGAKADYTFQTTTGTIAVRGTEGDIDVTNGGNSLTVNVYEVCDPALPVTVTTRDGQTYTLTPGQGMIANFVNGVVKAQVQQLTQNMVNQFAPDFGVPSSWDQMSGSIVTYANNKATTAANSATGGYGGQVISAVGGLGGLFGHKSAPATATPAPATAAPAPAATSTSCQHP